MRRSHTHMYVHIYVHIRLYGSIYIDIYIYRYIGLYKSNLRHARPGFHVCACHEPRSAVRIQHPVRFHLQLMHLQERMPLTSHAFTNSGCKRTMRIIEVQQNRQHHTSVKQILAANMARASTGRAHDA